ncbi:MAG: tyrosine-type recombinase/integrase [Parabacteroides sp.]|nr:tyrosine-type recombinase/integrase [Parabacteroides sp.]
MIAITLGKKKSRSNEYLHLIQHAMGLRKSLTLHVARHSFATLVISHGLPIEDVARMLGRKDVRTTQIYASAPRLAA